MHTSIPPNADFKDLSGRIWDEVDINIFMGWDLRKVNVVVKERDSAIAICGAGFTQTENIFGGDIGFREGEQTEKAVACAFGVIEA